MKKQQRSVWIFDFGILASSHWPYTSLLPVFFGQRLLLSTEIQPKELANENYTDRMYTLQDAYLGWTLTAPLKYAMLMMWGTTVGFICFSWKWKKQQWVWIFHFGICDFTNCLCFSMLQADDSAGVEEPCRMICFYWKMKNNSNVFGFFILVYVKLLNVYVLLCYRLMIVLV